MSGRKEPLKHLLLRVHDSADVSLGRVGSMIVIIMMALTIVDVTARFIFIHPISGTYEIMRLMLAMVVFLPFAYVQSLRSQIVITMVSERFPFKVQRVLELIWVLVALGAIGILSWAGIIATIDAVQAGDVTVGLIPVPTAPSRGVIAFGCLMLTIRLFRQAGEGLHRFGKGYQL